MAIACRRGSRAEAVPTVYCRDRRVRAETVRPERVTSAAAEPSALRRPYKDERLYVPIRAVAEAAGYSVSWDKEFGVTVKDGGEIVFQICPDTDLAHGPATADRQSLSGPCLIANGITYLEAGDLAHLLGMFYGG